jgi:xylan 1,4-beta-xylosidase
MYSSYTAASYARLWELARRRDINLDGALTWAFTFVGQPWFAGYRQLATRGIDLPVLNVFRLFARLGAEQVQANSSNEIPLAQIVSEGVRETPDVGVLATRDKEGRIAILLWHYRDDDVPGPAADVHFSLAGLGPDRRYEAHVWRVDQQHGDAFTAWKAMGSPANPTREQITRLVRAARLAPQPLSIPRSSSKGSLTLERHLPLRAVELIELGGS